MTCTSQVCEAIFSALTQARTKAHHIGLDLSWFPTTNLGLVNILDFLCTRSTAFTGISVGQEQHGCLAIGHSILAQRILDMAFCCGKRIRVVGSTACIVVVEYLDQLRWIPEDRSRQRRRTLEQNQTKANLAILIVLGRRSAIFCDHFHHRSRGNIPTGEVTGQLCTSRSSQTSIGILRCIRRILTFHDVQTIRIRCTDLTRVHIRRTRSRHTSRFIHDQHQVRGLTERGCSSICTLSSHTAIL
ncbi:MAG: hypothetical protein POELPBGB_04185 [Bacteroidia bacterium]|nr:hypothetical protein [Bacteroidia bacterium]